MYEPYLYQAVWYNIFTIDGAPYQIDLQQGRLPLEEWQALFYQREEPQYGGKRDALEPWSQIGVTYAADELVAAGPKAYASEAEWRTENDYKCWPGISRVRRSRELLCALRTLNKRSQTTKSVRAPLPARFVRGCPLGCQAPSRCKRLWPRGRCAGVPRVPGGAVR
jgi:hypothetical protein